MKVSQQVESLLQYSRKARNSDKELQILYMQKFGLNLTEAQIDKFRQMPSMETLTRCRRKIQEAGKYPADSEIEEERYNKYKTMKYEVNYTAPEDILEVPVTPVRFEF